MTEEDKIKVRRVARMLEGRPRYEVAPLSDFGRVCCVWDHDLDVYMKMAYMRSEAADIANSLNAEDAKRDA